ncbi:Carboxylesterase-like protein 12 [Elsinoe fawcettii]|nr:Carboxylesterase-like protein 12 [Elsinoe fawcettii]
MASLKHPSLSTTFQGHRPPSAPYTHYRGIPYATIPSRFADPQLQTTYPSSVDATSFGPRCPQIPVDVGYLLREPEGNIWFSSSEDEFACTNLDIAVPDTQDGKKLPVFFWVHGGSQVVSYGNGASKIGDVRRFVTHGVESGKPVIVVSVQYRLGIFHVGDSETRKNLGLRDLMVALEWTRRYIGGFGGDEGQITLAGESAGAALAHAMVVMGAEVRRVALMSGSLWMSGPRPDAAGESGVRGPVREQLKALGSDGNLEKASVEQLVKAQREAGVVSVFLQVEDGLKDWQTKTGKVEEVVIGDCEYEGVLWKNGVDGLSGEEIDAAFTKAGATGEKLKKVYHIKKERASSARHGALDLINDVLWAMPTWNLAKLFKDQGKKTYVYLFDQTNPWQASARAHHAVDLIYLFEGFDLSSNPVGQALAKEQRQRYLNWVHGEEPWSADKTCAFGPHGKVSEIDEDEVNSRRRMAEIAEIRKLPFAEVLGVLPGLIAGRISLHN